MIDNESLEFLGDAVLGFVIADLLFTRFPKHSEGYKSKVKAGIVSSASLARLAEDLDLGRYVLLGRGEEKTGGRHKHAILADGFEALIAAVYLDGGIEAAREFILSKFEPLVESAGDRAAEAAFTEDWKSAFQEWLQAEGRGLPHYRIASADGPDHRKRFDVEVIVGGQAVARATGRSKKEAEQQAAKAAMATMKTIVIGIDGRSLLSSINLDNARPLAIRWPVDGHHRGLGGAFGSAARGSRVCAKWRTSRTMSSSVGGTSGVRRGGRRGGASDRRTCSACPANG